MNKLTPEAITARALERIADCPDPRLKRVISALIRHAHDFTREVELTPAEWMSAIEFLAAAGRITDDKRNEFILLSDVLGVSAVVDLVRDRNKPGKATE